MAARGIAIALVLAAWASEAVADGARSSFGVSVRVVARLRGRGATATVPSSFVTAQDRVSLPCGAAASPACREAIAAAGLASGTPVLVTAFTDGTPSAVIER